MRYKTALIVGRFQPFHKGHLYLVKKALEKADKVVFGIGSVNIDNEFNPLNYKQRKKMLELVIKNEKIGKRMIKIVPLDDVYNDEKWLKIVKKNVGYFDLVVSNSEWTNKILEKAGYKIWRVGYYKKNLYEGWRVRKLLTEKRKWEDRIPDYLIKHVTCSMLYFHSILGGTFDHFHDGHKKFLDTAFSQSARVTIGLTTNKLCRNKFLAQSVENYQVRENNLTNYLRQKKYDKQAKIIPLQDIYGSGDKEEKIDAIFVTKETYQGAVKINQARKKRSWALLKIVTVPLIKDESGEIISSERIRGGEIDREGNSYELGVSPSSRLRRAARSYGGKGKKELILPEWMRGRLRKPIVRVLISFSTPGVEKVAGRLKKATLVISVGDIVSMELLKIGIEPDIKIIDFRSRRKPIKKMSNVKAQMSNLPAMPKGNAWQVGQIQNPNFKVKNNPGTINLQAAEAVKKAIKNYLKTEKMVRQAHYKQTIVVAGEEDLLALPAILLAPLGAIVLYGQWDRGAILVKVNEEKKKEVLGIVEKFR